MKKLKFSNFVSNLSMVGILFLQINSCVMNVDKIENYHTLKNGRKITFINISDEKADKLIGLESTILLKKEEESALYQLEDNRILSTVKGFGGAIYKNRNEYIMSIEDLETSFEDIATDRFFLDGDGVRIKYEQVFASDISKLKSEGKKIKIEDSYFMNYGLYETDGGKFYLLNEIESNPIKVFDSLDDFYEYIVAFRSSKLRGVNLYGTDFEKEIPNLIEKLKNRLNLKSLDFSGESLLNIDKALSPIVVDDALFYEIYLSLIAYVGEVYIRGAGGEWDYRTSGTVKEPVVISRSGKVIYFYKDIYESLHPSTDQIFSLYFMHDKYVNPTFEYRQ